MDTQHADMEHAVPTRAYERARRAIHTTALATLVSATMDLRIGGELSAAGLALKIVRPFALYWLVLVVQLFLAYRLWIEHALCSSRFRETHPAKLDYAATLLLSVVGTSINLCALLDQLSATGVHTIVAGGTSGIVIVPLAIITYRQRVDIPERSTGMIVMFGLAIAAQVFVTLCMLELTTRAFEAMLLSITLSCCVVLLSWQLSARQRRVAELRYFALHLPRR